MTTTDLIDAYPELENAEPTALQKALDHAEQRVDREVLGDQADQAVLLLAVHLISTSQYGQDLRLTADDNRTSAKEEAEDILRPAGVSWRTLG